ncbi:hypothetical protein SAMN05444004_1154 [Jannaschia faecimaris]|uniref:Uncharacterized protein n=1 Tax=Jannaschia faecimaris TaxID=1244108 RepID=A0A1H3T5M2_9RHOB|nr:hypothetical protein SAMN05444004_1154 [Jannaschia faecimaris]
MQFAAHFAAQNAALKPAKSINFIYLSCLLAMTFGLSLRQPIFFVSGAGSPSPPFFLFTWLIPDFLVDLDLFRYASYLFTVRYEMGYEIRRR